VTQQQKSRTLHALVRLHASVDVSGLARELKAPSSGFLRRYFRGPGFAWQTGYGAFSVRRGDVPRVLEYLRDQPRHHAEGTLLEALEATPPDAA
jgi:REP element-mobilizing transposase RayT